LSSTGILKAAFALRCNTERSSNTVNRQSPLNHSAYLFSVDFAILSP